VPSSMPRAITIGAVNPALSAELQVMSPDGVGALLLAAHQGRQTMRAGTGHQHFDSIRVEAWVAREIENAVDTYDITEGYTSLARGADQIYADILSKTSVPFVAVIPCADYDPTFSREGFLRYRDLLS